MDGDYGKKEYAEGSAVFYSLKLTEIVPPADCIGFGDRPGWWFWTNDSRVSTLAVFAGCKPIGKGEAFEVYLQD